MRAVNFRYKVALIKLYETEHAVAVNKVCKLKMNHAFHFDGRIAYFRVALKQGPFFINAFSITNF